MTTGRDEDVGTGALSIASGFGAVDRAKLRRILEDGTPPNTRIAYAADLEYFRAWYEVSGYGAEIPFPAPPDVVAQFVVEHVEGLPPAKDALLVEGGWKRAPGPHLVGTVERRLAALAAAHKARGLPSPASDPRLAEIVRKSRRAAVRRGYAPRKKKAAVRDVLEAMVATCGTDTIGVRDRALLLFGFASGGRRRSEIAAARIERLERVDDDFLYDLGLTKGRQDGERKLVPVGGRAAVALADWLALVGAREGFLFRPVTAHGRILPRGIGGKTVARIVQRRATEAGLDAALFSGHSLRSGFMTESGLQGVGLRDAMDMADIKTVQVAAGYMQAGSALRNRAGALLDD